MPDLAFINGTFCPIHEATVSIEDRGFQFGDGVYEVIAAYGGKLFELGAHLARLRSSAEAIDMPYDPISDGLSDVIEEGVVRCGYGDVMVYLQITRGAAPRAHVIPRGLRPTVVMTFKPMPLVPSELRARGARLKCVPEERWANCYIKAITLLPNLLAKSRAIEQGYDDAVFVTESGEVREGTSSNIYIVEGETVVFPKRDRFVLHGVTQRFLGGCADALGLKMEEGLIQLDRLHIASEVFMSSTTVEVLAVSSVDDRPVGTGGVGPVTRRLYQVFVQKARGGEG